MIRRRLRSKEYEYDIDYVKGKENTAADALSIVHAITQTDVLLKQFKDLEKSEEIPKLLKLTSNKDNFFQLTKTYLGPYDETVWLEKISNVIETNRKIGIRDNNLIAQDKAHIKGLLLFFNDQRDDIEFAYEPIQSLSEEEIGQILKENHDLMGHPGIQKM